MSKKKILVITSVPGAFFGASLRYQLEVEKEKYQCVRGTGTHELYKEWEKEGAPIHYLNIQDFRNKQKEGAFYWVSEQEEPLFGILRKDAMETFESIEKLYYLEMPVCDAIQIKTIFPDDIYYLAVNEFACDEHEETEQTRLITEIADFYINSFEFKELEVLENIRKNLLGM